MSDWTTYDEIRYSNHPYVQTHPDRLAVIAVLHGLTPPAPSRARVLEIGCGAGGNLLAMAYACPEMRTVGVDLAGTAIEEARRGAKEVGIANAEFHHADVRDVADGRLGEFDYVISHGLYAWIPEDARDALLAACKAHLAPDGIVYVSYNAMPGGHWRRMLREAAFWHGRDARSDVELAEKAQELFSFLSLRATEDAYGGMLAVDVPVLAEGPLHRIIHDELSAYWQPVWFHEFAREAARHGLGFLAEASPLELWPADLPEGAEERMHELAGGDRIALEQYLDLLFFRRFRSTLLCQEGVEVTPGLDRASVKRLLFTSVPPADEMPVGPLRNVMSYLATRRPVAVSFEELREALGEGISEEGLLDTLLEGLKDFDVGARVDPPARSLVAGPRPRASALARWQTHHDDEVTTLVHGIVRIDDPMGKELLRLLDGTRDREAIRRDLKAAGGPDLNEEQLEMNLRPLGELGLLHE